MVLTGKCYVLILLFPPLPSVSLGNTHLFSLSLWRWTTPLWQENLSHRLALQSSHMKILWRPATSVSFPPTVSRVSKPHLVKIFSYHLRMFFSLYQPSGDQHSFALPPDHEFLSAPNLPAFLHPTVHCVDINECQPVGNTWYFCCYQSLVKRNFSGFFSVRICLFINI